MMVIANENTHDLPPIQGGYEFSPVLTAAATTNTDPVDKASQQYQAIEMIYLRHLNQIESDAEQTQLAINQTEVALEDQGDSESARKLERDSINFDNRLLSADKDVHSLGKMKDLAKERKLEMSLTNRFVELQQGDINLLKELSGIRAAALASEGTGAQPGDSQDRQPPSTL